MHSCSFFKQYITMKQMQIVKKYLTFPFVYSSYKAFFLSFAVQGIYSSDSLDKSMNYVGFGSAQTGFVLLCEVRLLQYPLLVAVSFCLLREVKSRYFFQPVYTLPRPRPSPPKKIVMMIIGEGDNVGSLKQHHVTFGKSKHTGFRDLLYLVSIL